MAITGRFYHPFLLFLDNTWSVAGADDDLAKNQLKCRQKLTII
jgi:hypothetical protein